MTFFQLAQNSESSVKQCTEEQSCSLEALRIFPIFSSSLTAFSCTIMMGVMSELGNCGLPLSSATTVSVARWHVGDLELLSRVTVFGECGNGDFSCILARLSKRGTQPALSLGGGVWAELGSRCFPSGSCFLGGQVRMRLSLCSIVLVYSEIFPECLLCPVH